MIYTYIYEEGKIPSSYTEQKFIPKSYDSTKFISSMGSNIQMSVAQVVNYFHHISHGTKQTKFRLVLNQSEKFNRNPNLVGCNKI